LVLEHYIGCSGWSYDGWKGPFYPEDLDNKYWLSYYSQIFVFVEIDSLLFIEYILHLWLITGLKELQLTLDLQ
jgi:hypothetical protein